MGEGVAQHRVVILNQYKTALWKEAELFGKNLEPFR